MSNGIENLGTRQKTDLVWKAMRHLGIETLVVSFSGIGDEGAIDDVSADFGCDAAEVTRISNALRDHKVSVSDFIPPTMTLTKLIEELSDEILELPEIPDWVNGEGGNGEIRWIASKDGTNTIETTVNVAIIEYDTSTFNYAVDDDDGFVVVDEENSSETDMAAQHGREQEALTGRE